MPEKLQDIFVNQMLELVEEQRDRLTQGFNRASNQSDRSQGASPSEGGVATISLA